MQDLNIRNVELADIPAITAIYREAVLYGTASFELDPPDEAEMRARMHAITDGGFPYVVAIDAKGNLAGYAYASSFRTRPAYRWTCENSVYVDPKMQGAGTGKLLMKTVIDRCAELGFRQMVSVIGGAEHLASIRLHESLGFVHVGRLPASGFKHGRWLDSVLMQLALGDGGQTEPDPNSYPGTIYKAPNAPK
ncbi:MAG: N-acetyltransferase family protein [Ahrensia sp.]|nr:N-acetyltransferase family protein [Ahrensia sp.]